MRPRLYLFSTAVAVLAAMFLGALPAFGAGGTSSITGVAFDDADHDGVRDPGEAVFAGHSIYLFTAGGASYLAQATTDSTGRYTFSGLATGAYRVAYNSSTWTQIRNDWFPTTTAIASPPGTEVNVAGATTVDWGFRRIVRSTDATAPISEYRGPSGLLVQSYVDVVDARSIHDAIVTGTIGSEAPTVTVRFGLMATSTTSSSWAETDAGFTNYSAISHTSYSSWVSGGGKWTTTAHEYGHAWAGYHQAITQQSSTLDRYLEARGLSGDSRVGSGYAWMPGELIAEDYRQLLGPPATRTAPQTNTQIPPAADVPGLLEFLRDEFTTPAAAADTTAPTVDTISPATGSTVSGSVALQVGASDPQTATGSLAVSFVVDGSLTLTATFDPATGTYRATWTSTGTTDGTHTVVAVARDAAGNSATSAAATLTVKNTTKRTSTRTRR